MIIETNTNLYRAIRNNWLAQQLPNTSIHKHKWHFATWLHENNAHIISDRRLQHRTKGQFEDVLGIVYGLDYIKFDSAQNFLLFILKYS